ncbi:alcohol dehydrogenase [Plectosphaerella cucumerina]|uniref:alcohol dehydrogenase n=1 Tax=Plectosphaerella cucumerina TaxID=40658 RepID=A0A8K0TRY4_9PEZI|nr:alcohol dehydrogenase [Plectosphaerella cucumerina]
MASASSSMKAAVVKRADGGFSFNIEDVPRPVPGPLDVLVKLTVTGVCGTDIALASGEIGPTQDILGHEGVGYVVQLGSSVPDSRVRIGDRVGIAWLRDICGVCAFCLHPAGETRCREQLNSGRKIDGTFAEYALVPSRYLLRIPDHVAAPDEHIAPILCGGVTAYSALKNSGGVGGQWVAISGAGGGVGGLAVQYAKAMGFRVVALDVGDAKREYCLASGADHFIDAAETPDLRESVLKVTGQKGANVVLACATSGRAYNAALSIVAPFGTLVCVGIPPPDQVLSFHPLLLIDTGIKIVGSAVGTQQDILEAIDFLERGAVRPQVVLKSFEDLPGIAPQLSKQTGKIVIRIADKPLAT